jgi:hypothetical protein
MRLDSDMTRTISPQPPEAVQAVRIEPRLSDDGTPIDMTPPTGGRWIRDEDGGLRPADEVTAREAGLAWQAA